ncbi:MAG: hypothetical protein ACXWMG_01260 [Candidatus Limnocylindria bacterium]
MTPWMVLTALVAAINLTVFIALRGRWDRRLPLLLLASLLGTATGNAIGARTGLELVRIGDFHLLAASLGAQVAMLATDLLAQLGPTRPAPERPTRGARDGDRLDR